MEMSSAIFMMGLNLVVGFTSLAIVISLPFSPLILTGLISNNSKLLTFIAGLCVLIAIPWYVSGIIVAITDGIGLEFLFLVIMRFME